MTPLLWLRGHHHRAFSQRTRNRRPHRLIRHYFTISSSVLSSVSSQKPLVAPSEDVLGSILVEELCNYDAVIVVEQPGVRSTHFRLGSPSTSDTYTPFYQQLHASDLRTLLPTSYIARQLQSASSSVHVPYVTHASPAGAGRKLATLCRDAKVVEMELDQDAETLQLPVEGKKLIHIDLPELHSVGPERREEMRHLGTSAPPLVVACPIGHT